MQIVITGGAGFLGQRLASAVIGSRIPFDELLLADTVMPPIPGNDAIPDRRIQCRKVDLSDAGAASTIISDQTGLVFHLAAIVSSHAEKDFDLGWRVNLDSTRYLLDACRHSKPGTRFVFTSSLAVFGGSLPATVTDETIVTPRSSYGTQKAMGELLVNDYSRKGFIDGVVLRLPTICVRPGRPNLAASSFVSSLIREPLHGEDAVCPVSLGLRLWLSSPDTVIFNLLNSATLSTDTLGGWRTVNLPGISVTVQEMLDSLGRIAGTSARSRVHFRQDEDINRIVGSWPGIIDNRRALSLGFHADGHFDEFITQFMTQQKLN